MTDPRHHGPTAVCRRGNDNLPGRGAGHGRFRDCDRLSRRQDQKARRGALGGSTAAARPGRASAAVCQPWLNAGRGFPNRIFTPRRRRKTEYAGARARAHTSTCAHTEACTDTNAKHWARLCVSFKKVCCRKICNESNVLVGVVGRGGREGAA